MAKKTKQHPDDILIGDDEWIEFIDIRGRTRGAVNLDPLIQPMERFWHALEVHCVAECCGINALSLLPKDIWNAVRDGGEPDLEDRLYGLRGFVESLEAECLVSHILNQFFDKCVFAKVLDHVIDTVDQMKPRSS